MQSKVRIQIPAALFISILSLMVTTVTNAATSWSYQGSNVGGPTFNRPGEYEPILSGKMVPYQAQGFSVNNTTNCMFYSAQDYDGFLLLYKDMFDPSDPLKNLIAANNDAVLGINNTSLVWLVPLFLQAQRSYVLVTSAFNVGESGSFENTVHCGGDHTIIVHGDCTAIYDGTAGCLRENRFEFNVSWLDFNGRSGSGFVSPMSATDSANVYFFTPDNWEMLIKVIDFCSDPNKNSYAVYFSATTNVQFTLQIRDTVTGQTRIYENELGNAANTVIDDYAFACP
jgi:hypothetical protein